MHNVQQDSPEEPDDELAFAMNGLKERLAQIPVGAAASIPDTMRMIKEWSMTPERLQLARWGRPAPRYQSNSECFLKIHWIGLPGLTNATH